MNSEETKHSHIYSICFDSTIWTQYQDSFHFYLLKSEIHNFCIKNCFFKSVLFKLIEILIPLSPWSFVVSGNWKKRQIMKDWETTVNSILFHWPKTASSQFEKRRRFYLWVLHSWKASNSWASSFSVFTTLDFFITQFLNIRGFFSALFKVT